MTHWLRRQSYMGPGVAGWMVVGIGYLISLYRRHPERVTEVGLVHLDDADRGLSYSRNAGVGARGRGGQRA